MHAACQPDNWSLYVWEPLVPKELVRQYQGGTYSYEPHESNLQQQLLHLDYF